MLTPQDGDEEEDDEAGSKVCRLHSLFFVIHSNCTSALVGVCWSDAVSEAKRRREMLDFGADS